MRKILFCFLGCLIIFLSGCSKTQIAPVSKGISFNAFITYYNEQYICPTEIQADGTITVSVKEPEILKELKIIYKDGGVAAEFGSLQYIPSAQNTYFTGVADYMAGVFMDISDKKIGKSKDKYLISGEINGNNYRIYFSPGGLPLNMEINNTNIEFRDIKIN